MSRRKIVLPKKTLYILYQIKNKSPSYIGKIFNCSFSTVTNRIQEYRIPIKSKSSAQTRYKKFNFSGKLTEKAYLIGFRIGDMNVYKTSPVAETIVVRTHTTSKDQLHLIKNLFRKYGRVTISKAKRGDMNINCFLNESFSFLLPKNDNIEPWIKRSKRLFSGFIGGYIDAEGNFTLNQGKARFKIDSYDQNILHQIHRWLLRRGINSKLRLIGKKGQLRPEGYYFNSDLWRLNVNDAQSLFKFINIIKPFVKHKKRNKDMQKTLKNIEIRKRRGTIL